MKDLMIDLETLDTRPEAVVLSIGACFFDPIFGRMGEEFIANLELESQLDSRLVSANTLTWWMKQSEEARQVFCGVREPVEEALDRFYEWVVVNGDTDGPYVWGNGSNFDITITENLMRQFGIQVPWTYDKVMDLRTFRRFNANNEKIPRASGTHHNALDDAKNQALFVIEHMRKKT